MLKVFVRVYASGAAFNRGEAPIVDYVIDHDEAAQRVTLGQQCRNAFEAGQVVVTYAQNGEAITEPPRQPAPVLHDTKTWPRERKGTGIFRRRRLGDKG